jgi:hypothetical protein
MRIQIQLFTSTRIRIQGVKPGRIRIQGVKLGRIRIRILILVRLCRYKKLDFDVRNILYVGNAVMYVI